MNDLQRTKELDEQIKTLRAWLKRGDGIAGLSIGISLGGFSEEKGYSMGLETSYNYQSILEHILIGLCESRKQAVYFLDQEHAKMGAYLAQLTEVGELKE
jgi:hypothetical protein